jgi:biopolymer transport protein ExbD
MAKFKKRTRDDGQNINTASLPDIVFMLLFFFMVVTTIKNAELKIKVAVPTASEIAKLEDKSTVSFIYIGVPTEKYKATFGTSPRIQLNDYLAKDPKDIRIFIEEERNKMPEYKRAKMTVSLKADKDVKMGIVTDAKQELREANALKINYSTHQGQIEY